MFKWHFSQNLPIWPHLKISGIRNWLCIFSSKGMHQMHIWRTTWSVPRTSYMKASKVSQSLIFCFHRLLSQKTLASSLTCSVLFCCAYELLFLNAMGTDRNFPPFTWAKGKLWINAIRWDAEREFMIATGTKGWLLSFMIEDLRRIASSFRARH